MIEGRFLQNCIGMDTAADRYREGAVTETGTGTGTIVRPHSEIGS